MLALDSMLSLGPKDLDSLTDAEVLRLLRTARRHLLAEDGGAPITVALGRGRKRAKISLRISAEDKGRRGSERKVPSEMTLRLKRDETGKYVTVSLKTDVKRTWVWEPTGKYLNGDLCTTGVVIRWKFPGSSMNWGLITVAHAFDGTRSGWVNVAISPLVILDAEVIRQSAKNANVDAAIVLISDDDVDKLITAGILTSRNDPEIEPRTHGELLSDESSSAGGESLRVASDAIASPASFRVNDFSDSEQCGTRNISPALIVSQDRSDVFQGGTSGSLWKVNGELAAMQCGGSAQDYSAGLGQPLSVLLAWCKKELYPASVQIISGF